MPRRITFSGPSASAAIEASARNRCPPLSTVIAPLEAAFAHVVARAQNQRFIRRSLLPHDSVGACLRSVCRSRNRSGLLQTTSLGATPVHRRAITRLRIEHQTVVSSDLGSPSRPALLIARDGRQHVAPQLALAQPKRRRRDVEHEVAAGRTSSSTGSKHTVAGPRSVCRSRHLRDGQSEQHAGEVDQMLAFGGERSCAPRSKNS